MKEVIGWITDPANNLLLAGTVPANKREMVPLIEQGSPQPLDKTGTFGAALRGTLRGGTFFEAKFLGVSANKNLLARTVPANKSLLARTVPANKRNCYGQ